MAEDPNPSRKSSFSPCCLHSRTKDGDVEKGMMAKGSRPLLLLLLGRWLGFTSNGTGQDPASSQTDAELHHDDLAFQLLQRKQLQTAPFPKPSWSAQRKQQCLSSEEFLVPAKKINGLCG